MNQTHTCSYCQDSFTVSLSKLQASYGWMACPLCGKVTQLDTAFALQHRIASFTLPVMDTEQASSPQAPKPLISAVATTPAPEYIPSIAIAPTSAASNSKRENVPKESGALTLDTVTNIYTKIVKPTPGPISTPNLTSASIPTPQPMVEASKSTTKRYSPALDTATQLDSIDLLVAPKHHALYKLWYWVWVWPLLALALVLAGAVWERDWVTARWPASKPWLQNFCRTFSCQISPYQRIQDIDVQSSSLQLLRHGGSDYQLEFVLANQSATTTIAAPVLKLTLLDSEGQALLHKIVNKQDLPNSPKELAPKAQWSGQTKLRLDIKGHDPQRVRFELGVIYLASEQNALR